MVTWLARKLGYDLVIPLLIVSIVTSKNTEEKQFACNPKSFTFKNDSLFAAISSQSETLNRQLFCEDTNIETPQIDVAKVKTTCFRTKSKSCRTVMHFSWSLLLNTSDSVKTFHIEILQITPILGKQRFIICEFKEGTGQSLKNAEEVENTLHFSLLLDYDCCNTWKRSEKHLVVLKTSGDCKLADIQLSPYIEPDDSIPRTENLASNNSSESIDIRDGMILLTWPKPTTPPTSFPTVNVILITLVLVIISFGIISIIFCRKLKNRCSSKHETAIDMPKADSNISIPLPRRFIPPSSVSEVSDDETRENPEMRFIPPSSISEVSDDETQENPDFISPSSVSDDETSSIENIDSGFCMESNCLDAQAHKTEDSS